MSLYVCVLNGIFTILTRLDSGQFHIQLKIKIGPLDVVGNISQKQ
jgi:hypothetical protein